MRPNMDPGGIRIDAIDEDFRIDWHNVLSELDRRSTIKRYVPFPRAGDKAPY